jgi:hypothetical protein
MARNLRHLPDGGLVTTYDENAENLLASGFWEDLDAPKAEEAPKPASKK